MKYKFKIGNCYEERFHSKTNTSGNYSSNPTLILANHIDHILIIHCIPVNSDY